MKKLILLPVLLFMFISTGIAFGQDRDENGENIMLIRDLTADAGEIITIEVEILNDDAFVGFNLDAPLPEGFTYVEETAELLRKTDHMHVFNVLPTNVAKIMGFSIMNSEFLGNEGVIFRFDVQTPNIPGEYLFEIVDPIIGNIDAQDILTGTINGIITLEGDAPDPDLYTLTLQANPEEGGEVTGAGEYEAGEMIEVDAIPNEGWLFVNWTDLDGNLISEDAFNLIEMPAEDLTLLANFEEEEEPITFYTLTLIAEPEEGGEVTGAGEYEAGEMVEVDAIPNEGWLFVNWTDIDGNLVSEDAFNLIEMPTEDLTLIANFEEDEDPITVYTLALIAEPEEGGEVTGTGEYEAGEMVEVDAIPSEGWLFVNWTDLDGNLVSEDAFNLIEMPAEDLTLIANFEEDDIEPTPENIMLVRDVVADAGDIITIEIEILNDEEFVGFNLDLPLPEGFTYIEETAQLHRKTDHMFVFNVLPSGVAKIMGFSIMNSAFLGNEGVIFSFDLQTPNVPGEYLFEIVDPIIGNIEAEDILTGTIDGMVTLEGEDPEFFMLTLLAEPEEGGEVTGAGEYEAGEMIEVDAIPNEGWLFVNWTDLDGNLVSEDAFNLIEMPAEDLTLIANFEEEEEPITFYTLTLIAEPEEGGEVTGAGEYEAGEMVEVDAIPSEGWLFVNWTDLDGNLVSEDAFNLIEMPAEDLTLVANFEEDDIIDPDPENIMLVHDVVADAGDIITIEIEILNDEEFVGFNLDLPLPEGFTYIEETAQLHRKTDHMFVFNVLPTGVAKIMGFSITNSAFIGNEGVIFSFDLQTPNVPGEYLFEIVDPIIGNIDAEDILTGTIDGIVTLEGEDPEFFMLTLLAEPEEGGEVTGAGEYEAGEMVEVDAIPNEGWLFVNWTDLDGNLVSEDAFNLIEMPAEDLTLVANFEEDEDPITFYTLTLIAEPEEGGEVTGAGEYEAGEMVEVDAIPNEGWLFVNWTDLDGNLVSEDAFNLIEMPAEDLTLVANFEEDEIIDPDPENIMLIHDVVAEAGEIITIAIEVINDEEFVGFNLDVPLPEGFTYIDGTAQLFRKTNHMFVFNVLPTNVAKIMGFSITNDAFIGNAGVIFSFDVQTPDIPGEYIMPIVDPIIGNVEAQDILTGTIDGIVTLIEPDAVFELTLLANPPEGGEVSGAGEYGFGEPVEINAVANEGYIFKNWTTTEGDILSTQANYTFNMPPHDLTLTANFSEPENIMKIHDVTANAGNDIQIKLEILNDDNFVAFSLEIPLPEGFEYIDDSAELLRNTDHELDFAIVENVAIISASSPSADYFIGNEGVILQFGLQTSFEAGIYTLEILDAEIHDVEGENVLTETIDGTITLLESDILFSLNLIANPESGGEVTGAGDYPFGEEVEVNAIPNDGWTFVNWTDPAGNLISEDAFNVIEMPASDLTLIANFAMVEYTLTLIAEPQEGGQLIGAGDYYAGTSVVVGAIPNVGYLFVNWTDLEGNVISVEEYNVIEMPAEDFTLIANFAPIDYLLSLNANPADGGEVTGAGTYNFGDEVQVEAIPNEGWEFVNWTGDTEYLDDPNAHSATFIMPANDVELTANFAMIDYVLTLIAEPEEGGEVTGAGEFNFGDEVEVDAIPNAGWIFVNWTDPDGNVVSDDAYNIIEMPAEDLTLIANFAIGEYTLTLIAEPEEGGEVIGAGVYNFGDEVEVNAIPNEGWLFLNWTDLDGNIISEEAYNVIDMPEEDLTLIANFEEEVIPVYMLTLLAEPEEGGEVFGAGEYEAGETVEVDAVANEGWLFVNWTDLDGNVVSEEAFNEIDMPANDLTLIANFQLDVSVVETEVVELNIFPNPASSVMTVESSALISSLRMIDMLGQVVYQSSVNDHSFEINVSGFRNGMYFVQINTSAGLSTERVQIVQ